MAQNYINPGRKSMCAKEVYAEAAKIQGEAADATNKALAESGVPPGMPSTGDGNRSFLKVIIPPNGKPIIPASRISPLIVKAEKCGDINALFCYKETITNLLGDSVGEETDRYVKLLKETLRAIENVQKHNHNKGKYNFIGDIQQLNIGGEIKQSIE